jgi:hypothetical protein
MWVNRQGDTIESFRREREVSVKLINKLLVNVCSHNIVITIFTIKLEFVMVYCLNFV